MKGRERERAIKLRWEAQGQHMYSESLYQKMGPQGGHKVNVEECKCVPLSYNIQLRLALVSTLFTNHFYCHNKSKKIKIQSAFLQNLHQLTRMEDTGAC